MNDAYYENLFLAAEFEMAASVKAFQEKVAATGRDLNAPLVSLSWASLSEQVMMFLAKEGLNPLDIPNEKLEYLLEKVENALEWATDNDLWESTIKAAIGDQIPELLEKYAPHDPDEFPDGEFPNGSRYTETSDQTAEILEHRRDCKCPACSPDSHLEADYEDRVNGGGGGDDCIGGPYEDRECNLFGPDGGDDFADIYLDSAGAIDDQPDEPCDDCGDDI